MAFVARIGLFFQMLCVFPLLVFILRLQFMNSVFGTIWPGLVLSVYFSFVYIVCLAVFDALLLLPSSSKKDIRTNNILPLSKSMVLSKVQHHLLISLKVNFIAKLAA